MGRVNDRWTTLREAIELVLNEAKEPLTAQVIASTPLVKDLGFTANEVSVYLVKHMMLKHPRFPIKRIRVSGRNRARWAYYNPNVNPQLEDRPRKPEPAPAPVDGTAGQKLEFNPIPEAPPPASTVVIPPHVKSLTLEVGGVKLRIELEIPGVDSLAGPR